CRCSFDLLQIQLAAGVLENRARAAALQPGAARELVFADAFVDRHAEALRGGDRFAQQLLAAALVSFETMLDAGQAQRHRQCARSRRLVNVSAAFARWPVYSS